MNNSGKFAVSYTFVIVIALFCSLYASSLNEWKLVVFAFSPEVQKVVDNRTAIMEVRWRWLNDTLEMIIKVNDDDFNETVKHNYVDILGLLFDSDQNKMLTTNGLEKNDADECMNNIKCVYLGVKVAQFIKNFELQEREL